MKKVWKITGYVLAFAWAFFWIWFGLVSGISEKIGFWATVVHATLPGGICLLAAITSLFWRKTGAWSMIFLGLAIMVAYPLYFGVHFPVSTVLFVLATMALPPIISGVLLLVFGKRS